MGSESAKTFNVMVVDDSRLSRKVIMEELKNFDEVVTAEFESPVQALENLGEVIPDLIISDYEMPEMDGLAFCREIRGSEFFAKTPFVIISGRVNVEFNAKALEVGANETAAKGFGSHVLSKLVERYLRQKLGANEHAVMIVDDSRFNRNVLMRMLEPIGVEVFEADCGEAALELLEEHFVDLLMIDYQMPGMDGTELCKKLRADKAYDYVSIISVSSTKEISLSFLAAGADDFIQKPFTPEEVTIKVNQQLRRVSLEKELVERVQKEKALNHQKNLLLGTAAHDIRNPIGTIISYLSLVKENSYEDEYTDMVISTCNEMAEHALELLNDILDASNVNSGVLKLEWKESSLGEVISKAVANASNLGKKKNITVEAKVSLDGDDTASIDAKRIGQVLDNLLSNAVKYSHNDTQVEVSLSREPDGWLIQVVDQGQGIPADELDNVFAEFKKTSVKTTGGESSTGLGLAIVKRIVKAHGGTIWVESEVGKGSVFAFKLPFEAPKGIEEE